ncbi:MAG: hypothetical protein ACTSRK_16125 [Promethearchaeota archaeon]
MKKVKFAAISLALIILVSNIAVVVSSTSTNSQSDILIVKIGKDKILDGTSSLIFDEIQNRNMINEEHYKQAITEINQLPNFPTLISEVNLETLAYENRVIKVNLIQVSISELEDGVLEKYQTTMLIIIGHGSPDGLSDKKDSMAWDVVQDLIGEENAEVTFIASCFGEKATQNIENAYGFVGEIDNQVASYITLSFIFHAFGEPSLSDVYYLLAIKRFFFIKTNPEYGRYLYFDIGDGGGGGYTPYVSNAELMEIMARLATTVLIISFNVYLSIFDPWIIFIVEEMISTNWGNLSVNLSKFVLGQIDIDVFITSMVLCLGDFGEILVEAFSAQTTAHQIVLIGLLGIAVIAQLLEWFVEAASGGAAMVAEWVLYAALITNIIWDWYDESKDYNDVPG